MISEKARIWKPRSLTIEEITPERFQSFNRYQQVTRCWRKEEGKWVIRDIAFTEQWSQEDYAYLLDCLRGTLRQGGFVGAVGEKDRLMGFASVENTPFGEQREYLQLSSLHVSYESRRRGIGKSLFLAAADWARGAGTEKLYVSAHSAVESQAFYKQMGCVEAAWIHPDLSAAEPCDCQLEYRL